MGTQAAIPDAQSNFLLEKRDIPTPNKEEIAALKHSRYGDTQKDNITA
jgi:hypothetical protein